MIITKAERNLLQAELSKLSREAPSVVRKLFADYDKHKSQENLQLEDLPGELWKWIEGYENLYQISNKARVKSFHKGKIIILRQGISKAGYPAVSLHKNKKIKTHCVHRLVAEAFIPNPENKPEVDHIDADRANANVDNLRWVTSSENTQAALKNDNHKIGTESPLATIADIIHYRNYKNVE